MQRLYRPMSIFKRGINGFLFILIVATITSSCEDFINTDSPKNEITTDKAYANDETAMAAIRGIYSEIIANNNSGFAGGASGISLVTGLSSDEMVAVSVDSDFYTNSLTPTNSTVGSALWNLGYKYIYFCNSLIEGISQSTTLSQPTKSQLEGEAKFIRAFCYFNLINLFGETPIVLTTDYQVNNKISRSPISEVYRQITTDLQESIDLLADNYSFSANERIRPNKSAARALLARTFLYREDWENAEAMSTEVISNPLFSLPVNLNTIFLANSQEAIFQLRPVVPGFNTWDGNRFIPTSLLTPPQIAISNQLVSDFEIGDARFQNWVRNFTVGTNTYHYPFKYKVSASTTVTEYYMVLRLAEQYLIRAEARAQQNKLTEAIADLDIIRSRAQLPLIQNINPSISKEDLLNKIAHERRIELFTEWGHRWFDLKRTSRANDVLGSLKGNNWQSTDVLYPLPQVERDRNPNLSQNPGY